VRGFVHKKPAFQQTLAVWHRKKPAFLTPHYTNTAFTEANRIDQNADS
jgi:hypothetical protein